VGQTNLPKAFAVDSDATHQEWRRIVVAAGVSGIQVHDARMVAAMRVHGIANLLTLNAKDFRRYTGITVLSPDDVLASFS
jgi:predicted nucleic acid-binding protein